jgi:hypothetical protein
MNLIHTATNLNILCYFNRIVSYLLQKLSYLQEIETTVNGTDDLI